MLFAVEEVAKRLRNTKAVCRNCYIHPQVVEKYLEGRLNQALVLNVGLCKDRLLSAEEHGVLRLLSVSSRQSSRRAA